MAAAMQKPCHPGGDVGGHVATSRVHAVNVIREFAIQEPAP